MQTNIADFIKDTPEGKEAEAILRKCVHCGFCLATCPTYNVVNDELDSPRGRIYLMKQMLEGNSVSEDTRKHLDRCLLCRACETTCPSGVQYHRLVEIAAPLIEEQAPRNFKQKLVRQAILQVLPYRARFTPVLRMGQAFRSVLPGSLKAKIPPRQKVGHWPVEQKQRQMLVLEGCVQPGIAPDINAAAARVLDRFGISLIASSKAGCCGAVSYHLNQQEDGRDFMRRNIDAWWPYVEAGCEAIVMTASGCGATVKEYGSILKDDPEYAAKAAHISGMTYDLSEILLNEPLETLELDPQLKVAFQCPCSLQHAQRLAGSVENILRRLGFDIAPVRDGHSCCGSAGTYSIFQPELATELRSRKLKALLEANADAIASANIGCIAHLGSASETPVSHWIQIVDASLAKKK